MLKGIVCLGQALGIFWVGLAAILGMHQEIFKFYIKTLICGHLLRLIPKLSPCCEMYLPHCRNKRALPVTI